MDHKKKYLTFFQDVTLYPEDLASLQPRCWLRDSAISFAVAHIESKLILPSHSHVSLLNPSVGFMISFLSPEDCLTQMSTYRFPEKELILVPISNNTDPSAPEGGSHWALVVYARRENVWTLYDSLGSSGGGGMLAPAQALAKRLAPCLGHNAGHSVIRGECPQQRNGYDCGVKTCQMIRRLLPSDVQGLVGHPEDADQWRADILGLIQEMAAGKD